MKRPERGAALLLVLWATVLLASLLIALAAAARSHGEAALQGAEQVRAGLAAEAGMARAVAGLRAPAANERWIPDGRPYAFDFDGAKVTVRVVDVDGLVDLNAAGPQVLARLLAELDAAPGDSARLLQALVAPRKGAPGNPEAQVQEPWREIEQAAGVPGMTPTLYAQLAPVVTVYSGRNYPDASYAGPLVLAALRGETLQQARIDVAARRRQPAGIGAGNGMAAGAVAGGALVAGFGGNVARVSSVARMPDGSEASIDATLQMALTQTSRRPYKVLSWRANPARGED